MSVRRRIVASVFAAAALSALAGAAAVLAQDAPPAPAVPAPRVVGLSVARPKSDDRFGGSLASGLQPGVGVHVQVVRPGARILAVEPDATKLEAFTDDRGTDLRPKDSPVWPFTDVSDDGTTCVVQLRTDRLPAEGAREIRIRGTVGLRTGADAKVTETKDAALREGLVVDAGFAKWTVKSVKRSGGSLAVTFEAQTSFDAVTKLELVPPGGKPVEAEERGGWGFSADGKGQWSRDYEAEVRGDVVTLRVHWWGRLETVGVPLDLKAGAGL